MMGFLMLIVTILVVAVLGRLALEVWRGSAGAVASPADGGRLERIESALAMLEGRLDELQDQQRFLEGLLARRREPGALPRPGPRGAGEEGGEGREGDASSPGRADSILFDTGREEG
jgi:hypothetical protein